SSSTAKVTSPPAPSRSCARPACEPSSGKTRSRKASASSRTNRSPSGRSPRLTPPALLSRRQLERKDGVPRLRGHRQPASHPFGQLRSDRQPEARSLGVVGGIEGLEDPPNRAGID